MDAATSEAKTREEAEKQRAYEASMKALVNPDLLEGYKYAFVGEEYDFPPQKYVFKRFLKNDDIFYPFLGGAAQGQGP